MLFRNQKNSRPASAHYVISSFPNTFLFKIKHLFVLFILSRQVLSEVLRYRLCCILHERSAATFVNQLIKQRHTSCYGYKLSKTPNVKRLTLKNMKIAIRAKLAITRYRHLNQMPCLTILASLSPVHSGFSPGIHSPPYSCFVKDCPSTA